MTALAGIWSLASKADCAERCARMLAAQAMYGPHAQDLWDGGTVALGRRLFRTLPEDVHDAQPLVGGGGRFLLVADVRLDNRDELTGELGIGPEGARHLADADVLLTAWERWAERSFDRLVGDYAFALWDGAEQRLVLARDPLGARPLHYHRGKDFFAFASMPKGLHALPDILRAPNERKIAEFLALLPEGGSESFFEGVERVEQGHFAVVTRGGLTLQRHWEPQRRIVRLANADDYAEGLLHHLDGAVRASLRGSKGAVAAHLSAGFDSASVATSAALQTAPHGKVVAFTAVPREGFDGPVPRRRFGDEGPLAAKTAALHPNIEHVLVRTNDRSPLASLDRNFQIFERPVMNLCNGTWADAICDAAQARQLGILLVGQLGNMSVSYDGLTRLPQLVGSGRWLQWLNVAGATLRSGQMSWRGLLASSFGPYLPLFVWQRALSVAGRANLELSAYSAINPKRLVELDIPALARARDLDLSYRPHKDGFDMRLWVLRRVDLGNYNKGILGGWGVDQRDPTADRRLIEFCLSVPEDQFLTAGQSKALARRALAGRIAPETLRLRGKGYQAADWYENLTAARAAVGEEIARLNSCDPAARALDLPRLARLAERWPTGDWASERVSAPYRLALLRGVSAGHFLRRASGSNA